MGHRALALLLLCLAAGPGDCCAPAPPATPGHKAALCWLQWVDRGCGVLSVAALLVAALENQFWFIVNGDTEMAQWLYIIHIFYFSFIQNIGLIGQELSFGVRLLTRAFFKDGLAMIRNRASNKLCFATQITRFHSKQGQNYL